MAEFKDYNELAEPLVLPIAGKKYTIPPLGLADGIKYNAVMQPDSETKMSDIEFLQAFLGTAYDEMLADNVPGAAVNRAAFTALADHQRGRVAAEIMWATGGDPKAVADYQKTNAPNRAARRSKTTAAANSTKAPASTSGTKRPRT